MPLEQRVPGLPEGLVKVVRRCLRRPIDERYPSAQEVAADLRRLAVPAVTSQAETVTADAQPGAAPTLAAVAANAFQAELDFPARGRREEPPAAPPRSSNAAASNPGPASSPKGAAPIPRRGRRRPASQPSRVHPRQRRGVRPCSSTSPRTVRLSWLRHGRCHRGVLSPRTSLPPSPRTPPSSTGPAGWAASFCASSSSRSPYACSCSYCPTACPSCRRSPASCTRSRTARSASSGSRSASGPSSRRRGAASAADSVGARRPWRRVRRPFVLRRASRPRRRLRGQTARPSTARRRARPRGPRSAGPAAAPLAQGVGRRDPRRYPALGRRAVLRAHLGAR